MTPDYTDDEIIQAANRAHESPRNGSYSFLRNFLAALPDRPQAAEIAELKAERDKAQAESAQAHQAAAEPAGTQPVNLDACWKRLMNEETRKETQSQANNPLFSGDPAMIETRPSNIMLDLETLGTEPGCAILSIGAALFGKGSLHDGFYIRISLKSSQDYGLTIDADTLEWWTRQPHKVFAEAMTGGNSLDAAMFQFRKWIENLHLPPNWTIWSNGASFDAPVLEAAFRKLRMQPPWTHLQERCFRTLRALDPNEPKVEPAIKHHALEDAKAQALHAMRIAPWL